LKEEPRHSGILCSEFAALPSGYERSKGTGSAAITRGITASGRRPEPPPCHGVAHDPAETAPHTVITDLRVLASLTVLCERSEVRRLDLFGSAAMAGFGAGTGARLGAARKRPASIAFPGR
jgi:hypothetical protein